MVRLVQTPSAAIRFRGKVFFDEYHADCLQAVIECPDWPESHQELEAIINDNPELLEFGYKGRDGAFKPMPTADNRVRREWYSKSL